MTVQLITVNQRNSGHVRIDSKAEQLLAGEFVPAPDFALVEEFFDKGEAAVNVQALGVVDQLDKQIATLGFQLYSSEHG